MPTIGWIVVVIVAIAAGIGGGYFIGYNNLKRPLRLRSAAPKPRRPGW